MITDYRKLMKTPRALALIVGMILFQGAAWALVIEGVNIPKEKIVSGQLLQLNGAGVRTVTLVFVPIKAYVAAFYSPEPLRSADAVYASRGPLQFNFTFLQGASQNQVTDAWNAQFEASVSKPYPALSKDQAAFVKMFGPISKGATQTIEIDVDATRVYDGGTLKGTIQGKAFQQVFLSMWFGSNPVLPSLKSDLLGGAK